MPWPCSISSWCPSSIWGCGWARAPGRWPPCRWCRWPSGCSPKWPPSRRPACLDQQAHHCLPREPVMSRGLRLAVSWLTVLPVGTPIEVDRDMARRALYWAPVVGAGLGLLAAALLTVLHTLGAPALLAGLIVVATLAGCTRGIH